MDLETQAKIQLWRRKAIDGTLTQTEMAQAVLAMRQGRVGASIASGKARATKSTAKAKKVVDTAGLLGELEGL